MLHNKYTKAGALPNEFTDYVSSTYFFAKLKIGELLKNMEIKFV